MFSSFQVILTVSQIMWAQNVHRIFESDSQNIEKLMKDFEGTCFEVSKTFKSKVFHVIMN
jgi:hypothetical protein